jgi:hypothetical protein
VFQRLINLPKITTVQTRRTIHKVVLREERPTSKIEAVEEAPTATLLRNVRYINRTLEAGAEVVLKIRTKAITVSRDRLTLQMFTAALSSRRNLNQL